jgi:hypothetical protein
MFYNRAFNGGNGNGNGYANANEGVMIPTHHDEGQQPMDEDGVEGSTAGQLDIDGSVPGGLRWVPCQTLNG